MSAAELQFARISKIDKESRIFLLQSHGDELAFLEMTGYRSVYHFSCILDTAPYFAGLWFGTGQFRGKNFTCLTRDCCIAHPRGHIVLGREQKEAAADFRTLGRYKRCESRLSLRWI